MQRGTLVGSRETHLLFTLGGPVPLSGPQSPYYPTGPQESITVCSFWPGEGFPQPWDGVCRQGPPRRLWESREGSPQGTALTLPLYPQDSPCLGWPSVQGRL